MTPFSSLPLRRVPFLSAEEWARRYPQDRARAGCYFPASSCAVLSGGGVGGGGEFYHREDTMKPITHPLAVAYLEAGCPLYADPPASVPRG